MKKLVLMIALFGMSFAFNACTDPVEEIEAGFSQQSVTAPDSEDPDADPGWLAEDE